MGILDTVNGQNDIQTFLSKQKNLSDDLLALKKAIEGWKSNGPIDVGESGTLYRVLKFATWKLGVHKKFITRGTLAHRAIIDNPDIINLSQTELLKLDNGTSQWATAATLLGDKERLLDPPFKLGLTYEAVSHWEEKRKGCKMWTPRHDRTILNQARSYLELLKGKKTEFIPEQNEDFCFAYAFGYITAEEGEKRWPAIRGHESDRAKEMHTMREAAKNGKEISSKDHRVVQAIAMWGKVHGKKINILHPSATNKSWPQFWDFLNENRL
jgi:hypothetical protein